MVFYFINKKYSENVITRRRERVNRILMIPHNREMGNKSVSKICHVIYEGHLYEGILANVFLDLKVLIVRGISCTVQQKSKFCIYF